MIKEFVPLLLPVKRNYPTGDRLNPIGPIEFLEFLEKERDRPGRDVHVRDSEDVPEKNVTNVGRESVIAAGVIGVIFPKGSRPVRHIFVIGDRFLQKLFPTAGHREEFQPDDVPDKRIRLMDFRIFPLLNAMGTELVEKLFPKFRMGFRRRGLEEEREILANLRPVVRNL